MAGLACVCDGADFDQLLSGQVCHADDRRPGLVLSHVFFTRRMAPEMSARSSIDSQYKRGSHP